MIHFIWGGPATGKTTLANTVIALCIEHNKPKPLIIDDGRDFLDVDSVFKNELKARQIAGLTTILISQTPPPCWIENLCAGRGEFQSFCTNIRKPRSITSDAATATSGEQ
jgi:hypothetical protein